MAKNPEKVSEFLSSLEEKLQVLKDQEMKLLLEFKKNEVNIKYGYVMLNVINSPALLFSSATSRYCVEILSCLKGHCNRSAVMINFSVTR